jgi:hypothetical protein
MDPVRLEREDEAKFVAYCRSIGVKCLKLRLASESSWPDRTLLYKGRVMMMELKRRGERPTPLQDFTLRSLRADGFTALWSDDLVDQCGYVLAWKQHVDEEMAQLRALAGGNRGA